MKKFEVTDYGNLLVHDTAYSAADVESLIKKHRLNGLRIFDHWEPLPSLDFLREFTFLRELSITCINDQDISFLGDLPQLESFSIGPSYPMKNHVDLSAQVNLKYLAIQWATNKVTGVEACRNVEDPCLIDFPEDDLRVVADLRKITRLRVKTGRMKSLDGIGNLRSLVDIEIGHCRQLTSVSAMNGLPSLARARFESCRKVSDLLTLTNLPSLTCVQFYNCGPIPEHIRENIPSLEKLLLGGDSYRKTV